MKSSRINSQMITELAMVIILQDSATNLRPTPRLQALKDIIHFNFYRNSDPRRVLLKGLREVILNPLR